MMDNDTITVTYRKRIAVITLDKPQTLNSFDQKRFYQLGERLREVANHPHTVISVIVGTGKFFSSGADVSSLGEAMAVADRTELLRASFLNNIDLARAFYTHPKLLVVALNGPVVGLPAALISYADFIYAVPNAFLLTPFSSLGLAAEGGASRALRERLGVSKAKEALLMSRRIPCSELLACGFVNKIISLGESKAGGTVMQDTAFLDAVIADVELNLGSHLCDSSLLEIKKQLMGSAAGSLDTVVTSEAYTAVGRIQAGIPQAHFNAVVEQKKKKSKL